MIKNFDFCFPPGLRHLLQLLTHGLAPKSETLMQSQTTETDSKTLTHHRLALARFALAPALADCSKQVPYCFLKPLLFRAFLLQLGSFHLVGFIAR